MFYFLASQLQITRIFTVIFINSSNNNHWSYYMQNEFIFVPRCNVSLFNHQFSVGKKTTIINVCLEGMIVISKVYVHITQLHREGEVSMLTVITLHAVSLCLFSWLVRGLLGLCCSSKATTRAVGESTTYAKIFSSRYFFPSLLSLCISPAFWGPASFIQLNLLDLCNDNNF